MILKIFSLLSELNITISSILFRNSGLNVRFNAFSITALLFSSAFAVLDEVANPTPVTEIFQLPGPDIGSHDDQGILKIHFSSQTICQLTIIQYLQQDIVNIRMCFFNFIQQNYTIRFPSVLFQLAVRLLHNPHIPEALQSNGSQ